MLRGSQYGNHTVVARGFNIEITYLNIQCLKNGRWLNDQIINFYFGMIVQRSVKHKCFAMNTFFMDKLVKDSNGYKYKNVKKWTKRFNPFELDKLFIPIHQPGHWTLLVVYFKKKLVHYYDSMGGDGRLYRDAILRWLGDEAEKRYITDFEKWATSAESSPRQSNGSDCGVFLLMSADYLSDDIPLTFGQSDMAFFRRKIVLDIIHGSLDYPLAEAAGDDDQGT